MSRKKTSRSRAPARGRSTLLERLGELSRNLWWSWDSDARALWERVAASVPERRRAELVRNPVALLGALSASARARLEEDADLGRALTRVERRFRAATRPVGGERFGLSSRAPVAYFSMEFGLHESLPIYAGGLGLLAGDHLKSASDLGVPLVGVGLFYRRGYFRQSMDGRGRHHVTYPTAKVDELPISVVEDDAGREIRIEVDLLDRTIALRAWRIDVGRVACYLLDSDLPENAPRDRKITHRLYGGTREDRIRQEILAGLGGVRLLRRLGIDPGVWHLNEGHVVFLTLERLRELVVEGGYDLDAAIELISADTVFTTHTPVPEGNEVFDLALADRYLRPHAEESGIPVEDYLRIGLDEAPGGGGPVLSLTVLAMRFSSLRNGVSALHGEVSRGMWSKLWPGFRPEETPVGSVTNGVHTPTWVAPGFDALFREHLGEDWSDHLHEPAFWEGTRALPAADVWAEKAKLRADLVDFVRERTAEQMRREGASEAKVAAATEGLLDPNALTIGFARRFALYKRSALMFRDVERAERLFASAKRPVQIIFAGKPHPEDAEGAKVFERIAKISRMPEFQGRVVLLENYDIDMARRMVQGVDVWLNNPRRPLEASGTSGQKVPVNAGVNVSILDGWWCEGYAKDTGFAFGKPIDYDDTEKQDEEDCAALLRTFEKDVVPLFYKRDKSDRPAGWLKLVLSSMAQLVPRFSTHTMVSNYAEQLYAPAREYGDLLRSRKCSLASDLAAWRERAERAWPLVHVRSVSPAGGRRGKSGASAVDVAVYLAGIPAEEILCSAESGDLVPVASSNQGGDGVDTLRVQVDGRGTYRLFPSHPDLMHPQEFGRSVEFEVR